MYLQVQQRFSNATLLMMIHDDDDDDDRLFSSNDMVKISMDTFVQRFQPNRYENWLQGIDYGRHPEDPPNVYVPAPLPNHLEVFCEQKYD